MLNEREDISRDEFNESELEDMAPATNARIRLYAGSKTLLDEEELDQPSTWLEEDDIDDD